MKDAAIPRAEIAAAVLEDIDDYIEPPMSLDDAIETVDEIRAGLDTRIVSMRSERDRLNR